MQMFIPVYIADIYSPLPEVGNRFITPHKTVLDMKNKTKLTLLHSERPKLYAILAFLSAIVLNSH